MDYYKNLLEHKRNNFEIIIGITLLAVFWIIIKKNAFNSFQTFDWVFFSFYILFGIVSILHGFGVQVEKFFFKSFIRINDNIISIKISVCEKEKTILWDEINEIEYKAVKLIIKQKDESEISFSLSKLDFMTIQEVKRTLKEIAISKEVMYNEFGNSD